MLPCENFLLNPARNVALIGPMGSGKSSIGKRLASRFGLRFVDADREIERRTGTSIAIIFDCEGEVGFREREQCVLADLLSGDDTLIATGGGAVLQPEIRQLLHARSFVVHLHAGVEAQLARLARDRTRPLLADSARREEVLRELAAARGPLYDEIADLRFDTDALPAADAAAQLGHRLDTQWQRGDEGNAAQQVHA